MGPHRSPSAMLPERRSAEARMQIAQLPHVDEHSVVIAAEPIAVWTAVAEAMDRSFSHPVASVYAGLIRCVDQASSGPRPFVEGSTIPGFHVAAAVPGSELVLQGQHRFAAYALIYRFERVGAGRTRLRAETRAAFPGVAGATYRLLVIGSGGHALLVRRRIANVKRRLEWNARTDV